MRCIVAVDDNGDVVSTSHIRFGIEDYTTTDDQGVVSNHGGLRTWLEKGTADIDAQGKLVIDGNVQN